MIVTDEMVERLLRPIIGIENRTAQEAFDIMADRFRALSEGDAPAPEAVVVKALEWRGPFKKFNGCWTADSPFGTYSVVNEDGWWCVLRDGPFGKDFEWLGNDLSKDTLETAKAAAQADYERRIRSALVWNTIAPDWNVITPDWSVIAPTPIEQRVKALDDLASAYPGDTDGSIRAAISPAPEAVKALLTEAAEMAERSANLNEVYQPREDYLRFARQCRAAIAGGAADDEWRLVPVEPTEAMLEAARHYNYGYVGGEHKWSGLYKAMLSASPTGRE